MFREVKTDMSYSTSEKNEKTSARTRGSGSPFRCISNLVQQMNQEKDQELSVARLRVQELEALAASRQKEVCMLQTRLATTESMTRDVIRDLLGVKLGITMQPKRNREISGGSSSTERRVLCKEKLLSLEHVEKSEIQDFI
ncbi:phragmoplast orienting kinesin [Trifolium repens]|nr:phragmoplast orienting kinesin [Trifolium repens]